MTVIKISAEINTQKKCQYENHWCVVADLILCIKYIIF